MPIYSYKCDKCGEVAELIRKISESDNAEICTKCHGEMHKIFDASGVGFELKGNWFKTTGKY